jgi:polyhydroxybutyrate depolymerase
MHLRKGIVLSPLLIVIFLLLFGQPRGNANPDAQKGDSTGSSPFGGLERIYRIHIPPSYDKARLSPLLIALHGGGGTGKKMEKLTLGGFNKLSDREGFIVVYPDGIEKHWNDGRENVSYRAHREKVDDVGFLSALIDALMKERNIDRNLVYVTGISNGAMMSFRLACELSQKITGYPLERCQKTCPSNAHLLDGSRY